MSILKGGKKDVAASYDKYADMLYRIALLQLGNSADAEDAVQDVFIKYMNETTFFHSPEHEKAWFLRVTINHCHDMLRRKKVRSTEPIENADNVFYRQHFDESSYGFMEVFEKLPEKNKTAMLLHYFEGFSVEETARILGISVSGAKMRLSRGRDILKDLMEKEDPDAR